ncbi:DNA polymerase III delta [Thermovibrio ammonificans HB-1]|uniref:DNA-directed DNA polymerase n=1 Tax=Thermovibrio ammonificans (strain DSM 15698 / JCM 12110 / HB-1) TaxID=648996 RepID=E8T5U5_THEA1|nr:DNA polymerase III delta [Thermovibrio ammonificans HB-1]
MKVKQLKTHEALKLIGKKLPFKKVLIHGEEVYLTQQFVKKVAALHPVERFFPEAIDEFLNFTGSSLFGGSSIPVILYAEELPKTLKKKKERELFLKKLRSLDTFIVAAHCELDYRTLKGELFSQVEQLCDALLTSERLPVNAIYGLLNKKFLQSGKKVSKEVLKLLVELVGTDLTELRHEAEKLINYPGELTPEVVRGLVFPTEKSNAFTLIYPLARGNTKEYLKQLNALLASGNEPLQLIALLQTQARQAVKLALKKQVKLPKEAAKQMALLLKQVGAKRMLLLLKALNEAEFAVKSGRERGELALKKLALGDNFK